MLSTDNALVPVSIDVNSLNNGTHSASFKLYDVYSTRCYYDSVCASCHGSKYVTTAWQRVDGGSFANTSLGFTVAKPVTAAPSWVSPSAKRYFTGSTSPTTVGFSWASVPNATSYKLDILDAIPGSLVQEGTPTNTSFTSTSLTPLKRYSWKVAGVNSLGTGPFSETRKFIIGPTMECFPEIGQPAPAQGHLDTCYDLNSSTDRYLLKDISRRQNMNVDGHNGHMSDSASISTFMYSDTSEPMVDTDNNWGNTWQKPGVDAQINAGIMYDYLNSRFYVNSTSNINRLLQKAMKNIVRSQVTDNCSVSQYIPDQVPTVSYCTGSPYNTSISLGRLAHEWGHAISLTGFFW
jgi:hypothetical protein